MLTDIVIQHNAIIRVENNFFSFHQNEKRISCARADQLAKALLAVLCIGSIDRRKRFFHPRLFRMRVAIIRQCDNSSGREEIIPSLPTMSAVDESPPYTTLHSFQHTKEEGKQLVDFALLPHTIKCK